jgi:hypothetical protein
MQNSPSDPVSPYLNSPLRSLAEVCRAAGRHDNGRTCPHCPLLRSCKPAWIAGNADPSPPHGDE